MFKSQQSFYKSKEWERFRKLIIDRDTNDDGYVVCALCGKPILKPYKLIVDHIKELDDVNVNDVTVSLNPDNCRCVCFDCHNKRHERFGKKNYMNKGKQVYIVYGAPCCGKSSYVADHATEYDLIVDMDNIYQMISNNKRYNKPNRLNGAAFMIRDCLYDIIKYRNGKWHNAYIITTGARSGDRQRLKERVNADEFIFVEATKEECLLRAETRGDQAEEWKSYINKWFDDYEPAE